MAKSLPPVELDLLSTLKKEGRTSLQEIGLKHIKPDMKYQCRVEMNLDHVRLLQGMMEGGEGLDAIVVFQCVRTKKYILADGFHRYEAHRRMKMDSIRAYVIQSEAYDEEATRFAASANLKRTLLTVNDADKKKAMEAMLKFAKYREWSAAMLGRECGIGAATAQKWKFDFHGRNDIPLPPVIVRSDGKKQSAFPVAPGQVRTRARLLKSGGASYEHYNKNIYLGRTSTPQPSDKMIATQSGAKVARLAGWPSGDSEILQYLATREVSSWVVPGTEKIGSTFRLRDIAFTSLRQSDSQSLRAAAYMLLWQSLASPGIARLRVVVAFGFVGIGWYEIGGFRKLGVQFVTPEEFFAELAADDTATTKPAPSPRPATGANHATL